MKISVLFTAVFSVFIQLIGAAQASDAVHCVVTRTNLNPKVPTEISPTRCIVVDFTLGKYDNKSEFSDVCKIDVSYSFTDKNGDAAVFDLRSFASDVSSESYEKSFPKVATSINFGSVDRISKSFVLTLGADENNIFEEKCERK